MTWSIEGPPVNGITEILTPGALDLLAMLHRKFRPRWQALLAEREVVQEQILRGGQLDFLPETSAIRAGDWQVPPPPSDLTDRRVEITGPTDPKLAINALNSGAKVWLADLEDANTPHWTNVIGGQVVLRDAVRGLLTWTNSAGKTYQLDAVPRPTIVPRPRGWHLTENHLQLDGEPAIAALIDAGLYLAHNANELLGRGSGPYFYLPKLESYQEAALWHDVFAQCEASLDLPTGSIRATVLIETIPAAFQMEEILHALGPYAAGLNAGRWDYLFSIIKMFRQSGPDFVLPDRSAVTMTSPMMRAYTDLLVATGHKRGAMVIGGMAAFIPNRRDEAINATAFAKVRADKEREAADGFDGSWVAHPDLVPLCQEVFDAVLGDRPNQLDRKRDDVEVGAKELLAVAKTPGEITEVGVRENVSVAVHYLAAWLAGQGAVGINNLMEDAATAEISRSQLWQWLQSAAALPDGRVITQDWLELVQAQEVARLHAAGLPAEVAENLDDAARLFARLALAQDYPAFLTLSAYELVLAREGTDADA